MTIAKSERHQQTPTCERNHVRSAFSYSNLTGRFPWVAPECMSPKAVLSLRSLAVGKLAPPGVSLGGIHREDTPKVKIGIQVARGRLSRAIAIRPEPLHSFPWSSEKSATCWRRTTDPPSLPTYHENRCHTTSIERTGDLPPPLFKEVCALALAHTAMHCLYPPLAANTKKSLDSGLGQPHARTLTHSAPWDPKADRIDA